MRVGKRAGGRDGVVTIKAEDERIKYVLLCINLFLILTFQQQNIKKILDSSDGRYSSYCNSDSSRNVTNWFRVET